jgi:hypothetical protein
MLAQSLSVPAVLVLVAIGSRLTGANPYELPRPPMPDVINWSIRAIVWTTVFLTVCSAVPYIARALRLARAGGGRA